MPSSLPSECHYWSGSCSLDVSYCLLQCSGPCLPFSVLVKYSDNRFTAGIDKYIKYTLFVCQAVLKCNM